MARLHRKVSLLAVKSICYWSTEGLGQLTQKSVCWISCQIDVPRPSGLKKIFERGLQKKLDVVILKIISQIYIR